MIINSSSLRDFNAVEMEKGRTYSFVLSDGKNVPVCRTDAFLRDAQDHVQIRHPSKLAILSRLDDYPNVRSLLDSDAVRHDLADCRRRVCEWLSEGFHIFGAFKVGMRLARHSQAMGVEVKGFLDNDRAKHGRVLEGLPIAHPSSVVLENSVVLVASGRHGNAISRQLNKIAGIRVVNMHEFLYALDGQGPGLGCEKFSSFAEAPLLEPWHFISAFLRLDDEASRKVYNALIGMRTSLSISFAEPIKSPWSEEYFDRAFMRPEQALRFVDAGAASGDSLLRLEANFGPVEQAWLFEPELPAYYEALKSFSDRPNVWLFNMGLDEQPSRAKYQPAMSFDLASELNSEVPANITSYIQGVPLDALVQGKVGLFKLDIEGMEAAALRGARATINRDKPVLAVCAYHRSDDFWRLMDEVSAIRPDYRIGMRLYSDILEDITLYFY
ncbi:MAG: FkbM family methyltransferase [Pseudomonadaceae bacterium]